VTRYRVLGRDSCIRYDVGGESEIRTHGTLASTLVFKTRAINHSAISPARQLLTRVQRLHKPPLYSPGQRHLWARDPNTTELSRADAVAFFYSFVVRP
jgi:hypothetical protein